uniref:Col_cuticle_N domain-containing protein n=1 Tax=Rhabditophanes sp. KR3021 TaxID=114890 RepID=A0AC35TFP2_9BILA
MPLQEFTALDYAGVLVVSAIFLVALAVLSVLFNFCLILKNDDLTQFERVASKRGAQFGRNLQYVRATLDNEVVIKAKK